MVLLMRPWSSVVTKIAVEDSIDDNYDRQFQEEMQIIPTPPRVLASIPNWRRVQGGNTDDDDNDNDNYDDKDNDDKNNDDDNNDGDKDNDDKNNDDDNNDNNNDNDNDDDDTDEPTPSPTILDIKEPCTICNNNDFSLGVNTNAILPTTTNEDGGSSMTCNDLVQLAIQMESNSNECNALQLSESICCITPIPSSVPSMVPSSSYMPSMAPIPYTRSDRTDVRYISWDDLNDDQMTAAILLSYNRTSWDNPGTNPIEKLQYNSLSVEEITAAQTLGYTTPLTWDCWQNHYTAYNWTYLGDTYIQVVQWYEILGWDAIKWDDNDDDKLVDVPLSDGMTWYELRENERYAAAQLCYTQRTWDNEISNGMGYGGFPGIRKPNF
jgi:hypothetical protein